MPKLPEPAPTGDLGPESSRALLAALAGDELRAVMRRADRDYLYWDRFKHLPMPAGVDPADAWRLLTLLRGIDREQAPFSDAAGRPFSYTLTDEVWRCLHRIDCDAGVRAQDPAAGIPEYARPRFLIGSLMEEAIASSQIEGASTTHRIAKDMLREGRRPRDRAEQMILNNYRAVAELRERVTDPLTPDLIREIQAWLTDGTLDDPGDVGRLRIVDDVVVHDGATGAVLHVSPPASRIEGELERLCGWANADDASVHPLVRACILHFWLAYLHPFVDGNGRTARILFNFHALKHGYGQLELAPISRAILSRRGQYDRAYLYSETDAADLTYFLVFHLHAVEKAIDDLWTYVREKLANDDRLADPARVGGLNHRQRAVLARALRDPHTRFTIESHRASQGISYPTARADLLGLAERGYLEMSREGRAFVFRPADTRGRDFVR